MKPSEPNIRPSEFDDFVLLTDFFEALEESAAGRASTPLEDRERELLDRMADGNCSREEKAVAVDLLVSNREAMDYFASALKGEA